MPGTTAFTCHRGIAPMLWVFVVLSGIELVVVHGLIAIWWPRVAIILSVVTVGAIIWLVRAIGTLRRRPSLVGPVTVELRVGAIKGVVVPVASIAGLHPGGWTDADVKARSTLNLALVAWPNIVVLLGDPVRIGRRTATAVAHRLDDPEGFAAALDRVRARDD